MVISEQTALTMARQMTRERSKKKGGGGGQREGRVAERENMRKCVECIHYREKSALIQEAPHAWSAGTKGSF